MGIIHPPFSLSTVNHSKEAAIRSPNALVSLPHLFFNPPILFYSVFTLLIVLFKFLPFIWNFMKEGGASLCVHQCLILLLDVRAGNRFLSPFKRPAGFLTERWAADGSLVKPGFTTCIAISAVKLFFLTPKWAGQRWGCSRQAYATSIC